MPAAGAPTFNTATLKELCGWQRAAVTLTNKPSTMKEIIKTSSHVGCEPYIQRTITACTMLVWKKMVYQQLWEAMKTSSDSVQTWRRRQTGQNSLQVTTTMWITLQICPCLAGQFASAAWWYHHVSLTAEEPGTSLPQSRTAAGKDHLACKKPHAANRRSEAAAVCYLASTAECKPTIRKSRWYQNFARLCHLLLSVIYILKGTIQNCCTAVSKPSNTAHGWHLSRRPWRQASYTKTSLGFGV